MPPKSKGKMPAAAEKERPRKRSRKDPAPPKPASVMDDIARLEERATADTKNANDIVTLLEHCDSEDSEAVFKAIHALHRVLIKLRAFDKLVPDDAKAAAKAYREWLHVQHQDFVRVLLRVVLSGSGTAQLLIVPAVNILMDLVRAPTAEAGEDYTYNTGLFNRVIAALLDGSHERPEALAAFVGKFMDEHDDVRNYTCRAIAHVANEAAAQGSKSAKSTKRLASNIYTILVDLKPAKAENGTPSMFTLDDVTVLGPAHPLRAASTFKKSYSDCWLAFLKLKLPTDIFRNVLLRCTDDIIPNLNDPKLLIDFLRDSYEIGGVTSILSLQGLFALIQHHNLDYPDFYPKLYRLFDGTIFYAKYRSRFFRQADLFLKSKYTPAYLVAAFIKRISRLCLTAPPGGCLVAIRFIYNLLKRHPSCKVLIHNDDRDSEETVESDPYVMEEIDPAKSHAIESSLWETQTLLHHYHPDVARLPEVLMTPALKKAEMDMRRAAQSSYKTLLKSELDREMPEDKKTAVTFTLPESLFGEGETFASWAM